MDIDTIGHLKPEAYNNAVNEAERLVKGRHSAPRESDFMKTEVEVKQTKLQALLALARMDQKRMIDVAIALGFVISAFKQIISSETVLGPILTSLNVPLPIHGGIILCCLLFGEIGSIIMYRAAHAVENKRSAAYIIFLLMSLVFAALAIVANWSVTQNTFAGYTDFFFYDILLTFVPPSSVLLLSAAREQVERREKEARAALRKTYLEAVDAYKKQLATIRETPEYQQELYRQIMKALRASPQRNTAIDALIAEHGNGITRQLFWREYHRNEVNLHEASEAVQGETRPTEGQEAQPPATGVQPEAFGLSGIANKPTPHM